MSNTCRTRIEHRLAFAKHAIIAALLTTAGAGCTSGDRSWLGVQEVLIGEDSAGAIVELRRVGEVFARARVTDMVLGSAEAEISLSGVNEISFTVKFPVGATVTYVGTVEEFSASDATVIAGNWTQHTSGIFGPDTGTWKASSVGA